MWYGSVQNRLLETVNGQPDPEVGMGCTEIYWSDREPYEVIEVKDNRHCSARKMQAKHIGEAFTNEWDITPDEEGRIVDLFKTKQCRWVHRFSDGRYGQTFVMGYADKYYDYSF